MIARAHISRILSTGLLTAACSFDGAGATESTLATSDTSDSDPGLPGGTTEPTPTTGTPATGPGELTGDTTSTPATDTSTGAIDPDTDPGTTADSTTGTTADSTGTTTDSTGTTADSTGTTADSIADTSDTTSSTGDESSTGEPSPWDGDPLPPAEPGTWTWVDFPAAKCRDGSSTGIGVRYGSEPGLVIYLQSGGACFNAETCNQNTTNFGAGKFANFMAINGTKGIFDPNNPANPVGDWSYVFVPYCTGDVHAGAHPDGQIPGLAAPQQFVGYTNIGHYLESVVPTFVDTAEHVLVTGESAGGFGSLFNYDRIAGAFPGRPVALVDDSGPILPDQYMAPCLQKLWRELWSLDANLPADCLDCFPADGGGLVHMIEYLGDKYADQHLGIVSSLRDASIIYFFHFGMNACQVGVYPPSDYEQGLGELRDDWMTSDAWATFYPDSEQHTWLTPSLFSAQIGDVGLAEWFTDLIAGVSTHVAG